MSDPLKTLLEKCKCETPDQVHALVAKTRTLETSIKIITDQVRAWGFTNKKQESNVQLLARALHTLHRKANESTSLCTAEPNKTR